MPAANPPNHELCPQVRVYHASTDQVLSVFFAFSEGESSIGEVGIAPAVLEKLRVGGRGGGAEGGAIVAKSAAAAAGKGAGVKIGSGGGKDDRNAGAACGRGLADVQCVDVSGVLETLVHWDYAKKWDRLVLSA
jgi:hypothetical protein